MTLPSPLLLLCLLPRAGSQRAPGMPDTPCTAVPGHMLWEGRGQGDASPAPCSPSSLVASAGDPGGPHSPPASVCGVQASVLQGSASSVPTQGWGQRRDSLSRFGVHLPALVRQCCHDPGLLQAPNLTCFSARICLLGEAAGEGQSWGSPTSPWGVTASPATRRGERHPRRAGDGMPEGWGCYRIRGL